MPKHLKKDKQPRLNGFKAPNYWVIYTIVFLFMCALVYQYFLFNGKFFIWRADGENQHLTSLTYFGVYLRDIFRNLFANHSLNIPTYSFGLGYGGDIVQILHYYTIGDPLNLLSVFVPAKYTIFLFHFLIIVRLYLAGLAFSKMCFYFRRNRQSCYVLAGVLAYIFCGFLMQAATRHPYFIDPMIYFPIIVVGAEKIRKKETPIIFIIGVFIAAISNFYFFYMTVIFTVLFVVVRLIFNHKGMKALDIVLYFLKTGLCAVLGIVMAAAVFLPVLIQFFGDPRADSQVQYPLLYDIKYYEKFLEAFVSYDNASGTWTFIGCGGLALPALFTMFVKRKKRTFLKASFIILMVFFLLPFFAHLFNGLSYAANRWEWVFALLLAYIITDTAEDLVTLSRKELLGCFILILSFVAACILLSVTVTESSQTQIIISLAVVFAVFVITTGTKDYKRAKVLIILAAAVISVGINAYFGYSPKVTSFLKEYKDLQVFRTNYRQNEASLLKEKIAKNDDDFYRYTGTSLRYNMSLLSGNSSTQYFFSMSNPNIFEYFDELNVNIPMGQKYTGLDERTALNELANVKYFVNKKNVLKNKSFGDKLQKRVPYGYDLEHPKKWFSSDKGKFKNARGKHVDKNEVIETYTVYKNLYPLPFGYTYDSYIARDDYNNLNAVEKQETMLQSVVLDKDSNFVQENTSPKLTSKEIKYTVRTKGKKVAKVGNSFVSPGEKTKVIFEFDGMENCETYFCIKGLEFKGTNPTDIYNDDESIDANNYYNEAKWNGYDKFRQNKISQKAKYYKEPGKVPIKIAAFSDEKKFAKKIDYFSPSHSYYENRHDYAMNMGYEKSAKKKIILTLPHRGVYTFKDIRIICQPMKDYVNQVNALSSDHLTEVDFHYFGEGASTNEVTGNISLKENKILLVTIPYSNGWTAYVDGKKSEILRANTMYSALKLTKGNHKIRFVYSTPGFKIGIILSAAGCAVFIALLVFAIIKRKKSRKKQVVKTSE